MMHVTARAHTNIALLKYWGKQNEKLIMPTTTSVSLTLDEFYTDTTVWFDDTLSSDELTLDGEPLTGKGATKVIRFLDMVRELAGETRFAHVHSINHVPTAAGLASSASAFAALAGAASKAAGLTLSDADLSRLARQGSGSASRSIFGGFAIWERGTDSETSVAHAFQENVDWPIQLLTVIVSDQPKKVDSRGGMQHALTTSPMYQTWVDYTNNHVDDMTTAIKAHDLTAIGELAETDALMMHATNATSVPPFNYLTDTSWTIITIAQKLREQGVPVYATMDAGPNVKLISQPSDTDTILAALTAELPGVQIKVATPGPGIKIVEGDEI